MGVPEKWIELRDVEGEPGDVFFVRHTAAAYGEQGRIVLAAAEALHG